MQRVTHAVIAPAMAARARKCNLIAAAAKRARGDVIDIGAIHHQVGFDLPRQRRLLAEVAHAEQIAFALFAHIGHQHQAAGKRGQRRATLPGARHGQKAGQAGAVVGNAGSAKTAVGLDGDIVLAARRDHRVQVRGQGYVRTVTESGYDVARAVDGGSPAEGLELFEEPGGAFLLEERREGMRATCR